MNEEEFCFDAPIVRIAEALESIAKSLELMTHPKYEVKQDPLVFCDGYWKKQSAE